MVTIWPCQSTTARTTCRIACRDRASLKESKTAATSSKSWVALSGSAESARRPATPACRTPGSVSTAIASWKPGVVIARIAGDTSVPSPPEETSISRSVRSGNW